jgi:esterase/lipase superfamily enzyme
MQEEINQTKQTKPRLSRGGEPNYSVQRVHFATDRAPTNRLEPEAYFGSDRAEVISYGVCEVSIPRDHRMGELESPSVLRLEFKPDPNKHVVLAKIEKQESKVFFDEMKQRLRATDEKKAFVFIHGFNVSFENAARRTAQIDYDLGFNGVPIFYSWPSQAQLTGYRDDENSAKWSEPHLKSFFADLSTRIDADEIYVIAHSMGNRPTSRALAALFVERPKLAKRFKEIILMAPDIDADIFKKEIAPQLLGAGRHVTLYASSNDTALKLSKIVNGGQRLGDADPSIVMIPGLESIDASSVETDLIGHAYYADARSVLSDLFEVIRDTGPAASRSHLEQILTGPGNKFWRFKPLISAQ